VLITSMRGLLSPRSIEDRNSQAAAMFAFEVGNRASEDHVPFIGKDTHAQ
jgi:hypothetical protein